ncbi:hypothetical protein A2G06_16900 (plasmid) [Geobacter anodireducens]|nr:hypothetical protein A2G06_16900 [Geobacter anodireducens]
MNEELIQRGYIVNGKLKGETFGRFEKFELGGTSASELVKQGLIKPPAGNGVPFPFAFYKPPKSWKNVRPDGLICSRESGELVVIASKENKKPSELDTKQKLSSALEQGLFSGAIIDARIAIVTDETRFFYIDIKASLASGNIILHPDKLTLNPGLLEDMLRDNRSVAVDPSELAEKCWQAIWHATKEDPKPCLLTFVEIFVLKFLSDNLPSSVLPKIYTFYELSDSDEQRFRDKHGKSQIEYYVQNIRPEIKRIFPDKTPVANSEITGLFGLGTIISPTSIINGFAFLRSGATSIETFNRTFLEILGYFKDFGALTAIAPEFKLRLYETFLKKTTRKQQLGQFFTPRNVVRAIVRMAQLHKLHDGDLVLDPAAGVGGFILEPMIDEHGVQGNVTFSGGSSSQKIRFLGLDVDMVTHILAKANTLLHFAEAVRDPAVTTTALNNLMSELFVVLNSNEHLGTLEYPIRQRASVIMTNPPYVTRGSRVYKEEISRITGERNGLDIRDYYNRCGLGLESLFLRYISGALLPGGRAFVIVPQGMLTRSETALKEKVLQECNLIAAISLPRNTFFGTQQKTYIIGLERRFTEEDPRPEVFCAIASSVGESLDARRVPLPNENTLQEIAEAFVSRSEGKGIPEAISQRIKLVDPSEFSAQDRWDVLRFWDETERVVIEEIEEAVEVSDFIDEISSELGGLLKDLHEVQKEINTLSLGAKKMVPLEDEAIFRIRRGQRVTRKNCDQNPGPIPVYSGSKIKDRPLGKVSEAFARVNGIPIENEEGKRPVVTVNANGAVGEVFVRRDRCIIHDDVMAVEVLTDDVNLDYLVFALKEAIASGDFEYEAKLYGRLAKLSVEIPIDDAGNFDMKAQLAYSKAYQRLEKVRAGIDQAGRRAVSVRLKS